MALQQWAMPELRKLLPLDDPELEQVISYSNGLSDDEATKHLAELLGDTPESGNFIMSYLSFRSGMNDDVPTDKLNKTNGVTSDIPPPATSSSFADMGPPPDYPVPRARREHTNDVIKAGLIRAKDEVRKISSV
jgi:hypothetical protein